MNNDLKRIVLKYIEVIVVGLFLAIFIIIKLMMANKFAFLNLYYIPILLAGYYLGKKPAILSSILGVLLTVLFVVRWPSELLAESKGVLNLGLSLIVWGSFLILITILFVTIKRESATSTSSSRG